MKPIKLISLMSSVTISSLLAKKVYANYQSKGIESEKKTCKFDLSKIDQLNIFFERGQGKIEHIPGNHLEIEYYFTNREQAKSFVFTENLKGSQLSLQLKRENSLMPLNFFNGIYVQIKLPESYMGQVGIKSTTGSIIADDLIIPNASFKTDTGNITVRSLVGKDVSFKSTTGDITLGSLDSEDDNSQALISSTTGKITVIHNKLFRREFIKTTTGAIELTINPSLSDYCIKVESIVKNGRCSSEIVGDPTNEINIKTTTGNVNRL